MHIYSSPLLLLSSSPAHKLTNETISMNADIIRTRIADNIPDASVTVTTVSAEDGKYDVQVLSDVFKGVPLIQRHRRINDLFKDELLSGAIHALTIKAAPLPQPGA